MVDPPHLHGNNRWSLKNSIVIEGMDFLVDQKTTISHMLTSNALATSLSLASDQKVQFTLGNYLYWFLFFQTQLDNLWWRKSCSPAPTPTGGLGLFIITSLILFLSVLPSICSELHILQVVSCVDACVL